MSRYMKLCSGARAILWALQTKRVNHISLCRPIRTSLACPLWFAAMSTAAKHYWTFDLWVGWFAWAWVGEAEGGGRSFGQGLFRFRFLHGQAEGGGNGAPLVRRWGVCPETTIMGKRNGIKRLPSFWPFQDKRELEGFFREFLSRDWKLARRRFDRFLMKFSKVHEMIDEVHNSFMTMEQRAISYREKAVDQQAAFKDIAAEVRRLGVSGSESVDFSGFAVETGVDHRGGDIACGKFTSISTLASQCFHDSSCKAFTVLHGPPWCLKHLRFDDGPVRDHTHVFFHKTCPEWRCCPNARQSWCLLEKVVLCRRLADESWENHQYRGWEGWQHSARAGWNGPCLSRVGRPLGNWPGGKTSCGRADERHCFGLQYDRWLLGANDEVTIQYNSCFQHLSTLFRLCLVCLKSRLSQPPQHRLLALGHTGHRLQAREEERRNLRFECHWTQVPQLSLFWNRVLKEYTLQSTSSNAVKGLHTLQGVQFSVLTAHGMKLSFFQCISKETFSSGERDFLYSGF